MRAPKAVFLVLGLASGELGGWMVSGCSTSGGSPVGVPQASTGGAGGMGGSSSGQGGGGASGGTGGSSESGGPSITIALPDAGPLEDPPDLAPAVTWPPPNFVNVTAVSIG